MRIRQFRSAILLSTCLVAPAAALPAAAATFNVNDQASLANAMQQMVTAGTNQSHTINITGSFVMSADVAPVVLQGGQSLTVNGNGNTIDGGGAFRPFFISSSPGGVGGTTTTINNLTIVNGGGIGGNGGGGGMGAGGALFVDQNATVILDMANFSGTAKGGDGNLLASFQNFAGGGLGGNGGTGTEGGGGGLYGNGGGISGISDAGSGGGGALGNGGNAVNDQGGGGGGGFFGNGGNAVGQTGGGGGGLTVNAGVAPTPGAPEGGAGGVSGVAGTTAVLFGGGGGAGGEGASGGNGAFGGGGGGAGDDTGFGGDGGYFGGGGGADLSNQAGDGGDFGGGAGGEENAAGNGGYGGGGGSTSSTAGTGGFGGGGGGSLSGVSGVGGFGGGAGAIDGSGGGAAFGGAIFVRQGGTLVLQGAGTLGAGALTAGQGAGAGGDGQVAGSSIFLDNATVTFNPGAGQVQTVLGSIADGWDTGNTRNGVLVKTGAGETILQGANQLTGGMTVNGGLLTVNAFNSSFAQVNAGGTLGGVGVFSSGFGITGTVAPGASGNGVGALSGLVVTFNAGSTYQVDVSGGTADQIIALGTIINGGTVNLASVTGAPNATPYVIVQSGAVAGTFTGATSSVPFYTASLSYAPGQVLLTVTANFAGPAQTPNQTATGNGLNSTGASLPYATALGLVGAGGGPAALDQLSGEGHASIKGAFLLNSEELRQAVYDRIAAASSAVPPVGATGLVSDPAAPNAKSKTLWGGPFGNYGFIAGNGNAADTRALSGGIQLGGDAQMGSLILGGTGALGITMIDARNLSGRSADATAGIYAGGEVGPVELAIGAGYTRHFIDTTRTVTLPGVNDTYTATYQAGTAQAFAKAAVGLPVGSMTVTPFGAAAVVSHATDGFTEVGSGPGALSSAANVITGFVTTLGIGGEHKIAMANGMMTTLKASAGWQHSTLPAPTATNAFATGTPFTVSGAPIAADAVAVAVSSVTDLGQGIVLSLNYDGQIARASQSHSGKITLAGSF